MELPPRHSFGADSRSLTLAPLSLAIKAAHKAAFPPPITRTSIMLNKLYKELAIEYKKGQFLLESV
jgi:hypothetical protein